MSLSDRIYDPNVGGDVVANLQIAEDGLYIFGQNGKQLQFWRYDEIVNALPAKAGSDRMLVQRGRPEIRLTLGNDATYRAIAGRARQLRRLPRRLLWTVWKSIPDEAQIGLLVLAAALAFFAYHAVAALFD